MKAGKDVMKDKDYGKYFEMLVKYSNEKKILARELISFFQPNSRMSFLDIGAGYGDITFRIAELVKSTTAVESNPEMAESLRSNNAVRVIEKDFTKLELEEKYDLILASHVFYYFDTEKWSNIAGKMRDALKEEGRMGIILFSDHGGYYDLYSRFSPRELFAAYKGPRAFADELKGKMDVSYREVETSFSVPKDISLDFFSYLMSTNEIGKLEECLKAYTFGDKVKLPAWHGLIEVRR